MDLVKSVPETINAVAELGRHITLAAQKAGMGTDDFQKLAYVGASVGMSMDDTSRKFGFLARSMLSAKMGSKQISHVFKELGVNIYDANGHLRKTHEVFEDLSETISKSPVDDAEKLAESMRVLGGRQGVAAIPMMRLGKEAVAELYEEQRKYGDYLSEDMLDASNKYAAATRQMNSAIHGTKVQIAGPLIEGFTKLKKKVTDFIITHQALIKSLGTKIFKVVIAAMYTLGAAFSVVSEVVLRLADIFGDALTGKFGTFIKAAVAGATAFFAAWALASSPLLLIIALLGVLFLVVEDILTGLKPGGHSVIFEAFKAIQTEIKKFFEPKEDDWWIVKALKMIPQLILGVGEAWQGLLEGMGLANDEQASMLRNQMLNKIRREINKLPLDDPQRAALEAQYTKWGTGSVFGGRYSDTDALNLPHRGAMLVDQSARSAFNSKPNAPHVSDITTVNLTVHGVGSGLIHSIQGAAEEAARVIRGAKKR